MENYSGTTSRSIPLAGSSAPPVATKLMLEASRDSPNEKIQSLVNASPSLFDEMNHMAYLNTLPIKFTVKRYNFLRDFSTVLAFGINLLILATYIKNFDLSFSETTVVEYHEFLGGSKFITVKSLITALGVLQLITSSSMVVFWMIIRSPLILRDKWRAFTEANQPSTQRNQALFSRNTALSVESKQSTVEVLTLCSTQAEAHLRAVNH